MVNDPNKEAHDWLKQGLESGWILPFCLSHETGIFEWETTGDDDDFDTCRTAYRLTFGIPPGTTL
jgi:hypothetical protein